jgi:hypothetical protein
MSKIESLTPEQEAKLEVQKNKWLSKIFNYEFYKNHDAKRTEISMKKLYQFCELDEPEVVLVDSPMACQLYINNLKGEENKTYEPFSAYINADDISWLSFYEYFLDNFDFMEEHREKFNLINECVENSYLQIQMDKLCVVSKYPKKIARNANNDLHCTKGYAIEFDDGYGQHYVNGRFVEEEIFRECENLVNAKICFHRTDNEDIKACIVTIIKENFGNEGLLEMLDAVIVDTKLVKHENNYEEVIRIYKTKQKYSFLQNSKGKLNQPYAWLEVTCPSTNSTYLIDTCPTFKDALECAKWHRPSFVPKDVEYRWFSAN